MDSTEYLTMRLNCESGGEDVFLWQLVKVFGCDNIQQQVRAGGYRLDFVTSNGLAWELDGARYHDHERDRIRDKWILATRPDIIAIVRVPAAISWWYHEGTVAAVRWLSGHGHPGWGCLIDWDDAEASADAYMASLFCNGDIHADPFTSSCSDCLFVPVPSARRITIGHPGSAVSGDHPVWEYVDHSLIPLMQWSSAITWRTRCDTALPLIADRKPDKQVVCRLKSP